MILEYIGYGNLPKQYRFSLGQLVQKIVEKWKQSFEYTEEIKEELETYHEFWMYVCRNFDKKSKEESKFD